MARSQRRATTWINAPVENTIGDDTTEQQTLLDAATQLEGFIRPTLIRIRGVLWCATQNPADLSVGPVNGVARFCIYHSRRGAELDPAVSNDMSSEDVLWTDTAGGRYGFANVATGGATVYGSHFAVSYDGHRLIVDVKAQRILTEGEDSVKLAIATVAGNGVYVVGNLRLLVKE